VGGKSERAIKNPAGSRNRVRGLLLPVSGLSVTPRATRDSGPPSSEVIAYLPKQTIKSQEKRYIMSSDLQPKPVYLGYAAQLVGKVCQEIDENYDDELPKELIEALSTNRDDLLAGVDRRCAVADQFEAAIEMLVKQEAFIKDRKAALKRAYDTFAGKTKEIVEQNPDVVFQGSNRKLTIAKNGRPALHLHIATANKSLSNIVEEDSIEMFGIAERYLKYVSYLTIDTDKVRADLGDGVEIPWAELQHGTNLRGLKTPAPRKLKS